MTTTQTPATAIPATLIVNPFTHRTQYVGQRLGYVTADGQVIEGTVEIGDCNANRGQFIVRFADGRWGFASYVTRKGA
jgi:hypothetical protein